MKTTVTNSIHFQDGKDKLLCSGFKKIFHKDDLEINLWDFQLKPKPHGHFEMVLEIDINFIDNPSHKFTYTKITSDMSLIDRVKSDESGVEKRKAILNMVSNDTFIEELDEFLESIKPKEDGEYGD